MANLAAGIGEICVGRSGDTISAIGLGSCVAIVLHDPRTDKIGVVHSMLPAAKNPQADADERPGRYVDTGIAELLVRMSVPPNRVSRLTAVMVGGAAMFEFGDSTTMDIGKKNIAATERVLAEYDIPIVKADTGGSQGRTVKVQCDDATVTVRCVAESRKLICFRDRNHSAKAA